MEDGQWLRIHIDSIRSDLMAHRRETQDGFKELGSAIRDLHVLKAEIQRDAQRRSMIVSGAISIAVGVGVAIVKKLLVGET